ncbi:lipopolysaccharide biosynthesis protein [Massilia suwonensis]|uniref:Lipopolysaccharide biosynthesis protein n=1 Tax=Massilia suwonensis TaxID=648895 RepID=A0ABW0MIE7_9BURK
MSQKNSTSITGGAIIMIAMRWIDRVVGVVSTFILARLLVPDDFGIVAMASVVVAFADVIFDLGINVAIIQRKNPSQAFYNTAWTLRILQVAAVATVLMILAPFAADYYKDPRVMPVVQLMALSMMIASYENVGVITFQKELRFADDAKFMLFKRLVSFATTIAFTLILQSYWGMVLGALCSRLFSTVRSYMVHPMRPKFSLAEIGSIFSVSQWVLVKNISAYLDRNLHIFLVGGVAKTGVTGGYTLANEISNVPGNDLLAPINRVLFPAFARVKDDLAELTRLLVRVQAVQVMVTFPTCVGFVLTAHELVPVALGAKWMFIVPFVQILALSNIIQAINSSANYVLTVIGKMRLLAVTSWVQIILFGAGLLMLRSELLPERIAAVRMAAIVLTFGVSYWLVMRNIPGLTVSMLARGTGRPTLGCLAMALALPLLGAEVSAPPLAMLCMKVVLGAFVYLVTVLGLWHLSGWPEGAETFFLDKLKRRRPVAAASSQST